ncbi:putative oleoyl-[acyl-carrier-protein] hydrolase [Helianthus annuus]|uniref:Acyl-[acyl-carrier-protein] hydrolase n=3 Tax=Helianthus annuus TaxID=4232 RepID=A0A251RQH5_HELAN|nr:palmitoyl-acyl carrier protein thioesterase, chloroplastic [Helianthus annuus]KAJ0826469.1 putative oleoyl-[acyl-carrier-protein] hydrolase [Helianthus annuus]
MTTLSLSYVPSFRTTSFNDNDIRSMVWGYKIFGASNTMKMGRTTMYATPVTKGVNGKPAVVERTMIPTQKQFVDPFRQGIIILDGVGYRQTVVVRSYEVGPDKAVTLQSILNLLQETALNHVWMSGLLGDGFGATHGMMKNNLIWVVSRMQVQVDQYPIWGEILEIDTWVGASGKNGMRRDWEIRSHTTGIVFARATSTWVMMNQKTRRLSKMPDEVRAEISPWFINKQAIKEESVEKIDKLDDNAKYINSGLQPKRSDLDMNHHVNNVKYVGWMLEAIPEECLENYQLSNIILEYRRECGSSDVVESLCEPEQVGIIEDVNYMSRCPIGAGFLNCLVNQCIRFTHVLQVKEDSKCQEIVRGKTTWKKRNNHYPYCG